MRWTLSFGIACAALIASAHAWEADFARQPLAARPKLEVRYTDATRSAFEIVAETYHVVGDLTKPRLTDAATGEEWLRIGMRDQAGSTYSTWHESDPPEAYFAEVDPSRINLYRRGPYFCEVHWLDVRVAVPEWFSPPLQADLTLYCYPDKLLASITWHATAPFPAEVMEIHGLVNEERPLENFAAGGIQQIAFPIFGETPPLPQDRLRLIDSVEPLHYDAVRGCYTVGSMGTGGFQGRFFHTPNLYDTVRFAVDNDKTPRTIYVCHENTGGDKGIVEGGVVLDTDGLPLPITVQISKNFAGEKEEKFYNPEDTPFSETYFPLYLDAWESREVTSLHLYQNWGRHMVKQFSSLGAWMDYFHSSTGVTETTCYVPFKYDELGGISIADLRAMSQSTFWGGQPQHDNVAGHRFLTYRLNDVWQHLVYKGTTYRSTGPNWMDIGFAYESADGAVRATVETFEMPQADELRNFVKLRYEILKPLTFDQARRDLRFMSIASHVQDLRYTHFATADTDVALDFESDHYAIEGQAISPGNSFIALYGEAKGSNAIVLQDWRAPEGVRPAASVYCEADGNTTLMLVPESDSVSLAAGDVIEIDAIWFPYGDPDSAAPAAREAVAYGSARPRIMAVTKGKGLTDFPTIIEAENNEAEFTIKGGRDLVPIIVRGFSDYRYPTIYRMDENGWRELGQDRVLPYDGAQVFVEDAGTFGAVFLVHSDDTPQVLRATAGMQPRYTPPIKISPAPREGDGKSHDVLIQAEWMDQPVRLQFPGSFTAGDHRYGSVPPPGQENNVDPTAFTVDWRESKGGSVWFEWELEGAIVGGRLSPNEDDVDLEFWVGNNSKEPLENHFSFPLLLRDSLFALSAPDRMWLYTAGGWRKLADADRGSPPHHSIFPVEGMPAPMSMADNIPSKDVLAMGLAAAVSEDGKHVCAIAWPNTEFVRMYTKPSLIVDAHPVIPPCPPGKRVHVRGKLFLMEGSLDDVAARVRREVGPLWRK